MIKGLIAAAALLAPVITLAQDAPDRNVDAEIRAEVIAALGKAMRDTYVFPEIAEEVASGLETRRARGDYRGFDKAAAFAAKLREDLREIGNDRHLQLRYSPDFKPRALSEGPPSAHELAEDARHAALNAFGIPRVARLPGNIAYLDVTAFWRPEHVSDAYESAMQLVSGSDALIIDLRANGGGDPASVAQLMSHFFARGDERHINSIYNRIENRTREFWTNPAVETRYLKPVYVLTSSYTFSGGEEFAYDMQTQQRATLIGEVTGGGANPGGPAALAHGFVAFIPSGRAVNPVTGTNWEHTGVKPEIASSADAAIAMAYAKALDARIGSESDEQEKAQLQSLAESARAGEVELPEWSDPRG